MADSKAYITIEAAELGIKSFAAYSAQLTEFDKNTKAAFLGLGESHRDQNYETFAQYFNLFWSKVDVFKNEVDNFRGYLEEEKKRTEDYINAGKIK